MSILKTIILICASMLMICLTSCSKEKGKPETESMLEKYAPTLAGERIWKVVYFTTRGGLPDTTWTLPQDTFELKLPTLDTITFKRFKLHYTNYTISGTWVDSLNRLHYESHDGRHGFNSLDYYFKSDSIVISIQNGGRGGYYYWQYTSYK